ncbi:MAG: hypothetical protein HY926_01505 [Elusimicrobia bacterium]|nr:hypothetical protein [Elusimicrobiota bacterium]
MSLMFLRSFLLGLGMLVLKGAANANMCALPQLGAAGAGTLSGSAKSAVVTAGLAAGVAVAPGMVLSIGLQSVSQGSFACFLSTDAPLAVAALPGTYSVQRLVPSPGRTMTLQWSEAAGLLPVTYEVFLGESPSALASVARGLAAPSHTLSSLEFMRPYYWRVMASDQFGRYSQSGIYSFSIAPAQDRMIAAPNPFHPGKVGITFMWLMPGPGWAELEVFALPEARRVFRTRLEGLQDGVNTFLYDGRDSDGRLLSNGIYTVRMRMKGANGNKTELLKIIGVR